MSIYYVEIERSLPESSKLLMFLIISVSLVSSSQFSASSSSGLINDFLVIPDEYFNYGEGTLFDDEPLIPVSVFSKSYYNFPYPLRKYG